MEQNVLKSLEEKFQRDAAKCWDEVMDRWISIGGTRDYPATWEGLYVLLKDVESFEVAQNLKKVLQQMQ